VETWSLRPLVKALQALRGVQLLTAVILVAEIGNVRTALVESAWNNRFRPKVSRDLKKRHDGVAPNVCAIAWKAQQRLCSRYRRLTGRGKLKQQAVTAISRELLGFIWAIAVQVEQGFPTRSRQAV